MTWFEEDRGDPTDPSAVLSEVSLLLPRSNAPHPALPLRLGDSSPSRAAVVIMHIGIGAHSSHTCCHAEHDCRLRRIFRLDEIAPRSIG